MYRPDAFCFYRPHASELGVLPSGWHRYIRPFRFVLRAVFVIIEKAQPSVRHNLWLTEQMKPSRYSAVVLYSLAVAIHG